MPPRAASVARSEAASPDLEPRGRPITAEDLFNVRLVSDPRPSPDGTRVAYVVTRLDKEADDYRSAIWVVPVAGGEPRQLTAGGARDSAPRWSPDGETLAFVSTRAPQRPPAKAGGKDTDAKDNKAGEAKADEAPKPQIWLLPVGGGEARQLTSQPLGASSPVWSPDGATIAFLGAVENPEDPEADAKPSADERIIDAIRYRHDGRGFVDGKRTHLWTIPAAGGAARQLTFGDVDDDEPAWSPDGRAIAFVSNRSPGHEQNDVLAIYAVPAAGGPVRPLAETDAVFGSPAWSPDGASLAMLGHAGASENGRVARLWRLEAAGGDPVCLTQNEDVAWIDEGMSDLFVGSDQRPLWSADGSALYGLVSREGQVHLHRHDLATGDSRPITSGERRVVAAALLPDGRPVYVAGDLQRPFELFVADADGGERQLTHHNAEWLAEVRLAAPEEIRFASQNGDREIQGWLLKPPGWRAGIKHPLIVQIHGGPHAMYGHAPFHELQLMAARGYLVLFTNPRGSAGYGEAFATCTRGAWGESDGPDILGGLDAALARGDVDPTRLGLTGGSYGGYLTNWLIGHSDRFRAAVTQRCVSNFHSFYGTSDIGFDFGAVEFGGTPWADPDKLLKHSPIMYVDRVRAPLLILHSERDLRCPIEQAEQLFVALKRLGRTVRFVRFPEEDHDLSRSGKPSRRLARLRHLIGWFDAHL